MRRACLTACLVALGCSETEGDLPEVEPSSDVGLTVVPVPADKLDVLFVIDNSYPMDDEQARLTEQLHWFTAALDDLPGGFPNTHIGVVSTDLGSGPYTTSCAPVGGDGGRMRSKAQVAGCAAPCGGKPYIELTHAGGTLEGNIANVDTPTEDGLGCRGQLSDGDEGIDLCDIQEAFRCIATLGNDGCGFEQALESARRALTCSDETCTNPYFLREDAYLAVVFLTNEDDCSARDGDLFNPQQTSLESELGPPTSYRCFEFGVTCDPPIDRTGFQTLTGCRSKTVEDAGGDIENLHLHPIDEYVEFFSALRPQGRVILVAVGGPDGSEIETNLNGGGVPKLSPSCTGLFGDEAAPTVRIHELARRFGRNGIVLADMHEEGICSESFEPALSTAGVRARGQLMGCMPEPLVNENKESIEAWSEAICVVEDLSHSGTPEAVRDTLPRCEFSEGPLAPGGDGACFESATPAAIPCWYVCDTSGLGDVSCQERWRLGICRDRRCDGFGRPPDGSASPDVCPVGGPPDGGSGGPPDGGSEGLPDGRPWVPPDGPTSTGKPPDGYAGGPPSSYTLAKCATCQDPGQEDCGSP